jgi:hypothetical protein
LKDPPGQLRSEIPTGEEGQAITVLSAGREVEQGARSALLLADGLFRLDVIPHDDTIQTVVRSLAPGNRAELRHVPVGGSTTTAGPPGADPPSTGRFGGDVVLVSEGGAERTVAKVLVGSVCHLERGVTSFTAQARLL